MIVGSTNAPHQLGYGLTRRETKVLDLLSRGATFKQIGSALMISLETVKDHIKRIRLKLHIELDKRAAILSPEKQEQVVAYAKDLSMGSEGISGKSFVKAAGSISQSDLNLMATAIEEGCERIDQGEW